MISGIQTQNIATEIERVALAWNMRTEAGNQALVLTRLHFWNHNS